ncbi:MAG: DUF465 domain-containing protein [Sphingomonadaceae bacterium]|nr:DUF465 domain-containing protein [Sphingomonadaceae bacterium]
MIYLQLPIAEGCVPSLQVPGTAPPEATDLLTEEGSGPMASAHVDTLASKHARLESVIFDEMQRPKPDTIRIAQWKKEKLRLKELIAHEIAH